MKTIRIPKVKVLELLKFDSCSFTDYDTYTDYTFELVFDSYTRFKEGNSNFLYVTFIDLSSLLYDRVVSIEGLTVIVV